MRLLITIAMIVMSNLAMGQMLRPDKWCESLITQDVVRFANQVFPPPYIPPTIYVRATPLSPRFYATAVELDDNVYLINMNIIYIDRCVGYENTLIHELQHVVQFHNDRLKTVEEGFWYEGKVYPFTTPYDERPWEIEAHQAADDFCGVTE